MFREVENRIIKLENKVNFLERKLNNIISCDDCGNFIYKDKAFIKKFITTEEDYPSIEDFKPVKYEKCVTKYFCPECAKKYKKKGKIVF